MSYCLSPRMYARRYTVWLVFVMGSLIGQAISGAEPVSFQREVLAVLSKSGCNMGACHGNQNGKGGLKLSLRGQDPDFDYQTLTRDLSGRRVNSIQPAESLLLQKPTLAAAHEGGLRFRPNSPEWGILYRWLAAGLPDDPDNTAPLKSLRVSPSEQWLSGNSASVQFSVIAQFADGSQRDVTRLAVYEPSSPLASITPEGQVRMQELGEVTVIVRYLHQQQAVRLVLVPEQTDYQWAGPSPANVVDQHIFAKLQKLRLQPAEACSDIVFLRRTALDLMGTLPTADEARAFLADPSPEKRSRWIDRCLERPEYADWWAMKWSDLLRNEEKTLDAKGVQNFHEWLRVSVSSNKPLDQLVRELVTSQGSTYAQPDANYYRALRDSLTRAETTAQLFLGVRLQCAKCHNHPFDRWTQADYYDWASLFSGVDYKILENRRRDNNDSHEFDGEQIVVHTDKNDVTNPRKGQPTQPRFLGEAQPIPANRDRLNALGKWLTAPGNRQFARVMVNRLWGQIFHVGLVEPVDDFRATNPATHPELLEALTDELIAHHFDVKHLLRVILNSRTYQAGATPANGNRPDDANYSHTVVRRIPAEALLDAFAQVTGTGLDFPGLPPGTRAGELPGVFAMRARRGGMTLAAEFLRVFGKPPRLQSCACERVNEATLTQAFQLVSGPLLDQLLSARENRLQRWSDSALTAEQFAEELYLSALTRLPSPAELTTIRELWAQPADRRRTVEDITWGVLTSDEFLLRR